MMKQQTITIRGLEFNPLINNLHDQLQNKILEVRFAAFHTAKLVKQTADFNGQANSDIRICNYLIARIDRLLNLLYGHSNGYKLREITFNKTYDQLVLTAIIGRLSGGAQEAFAKFLN